MDFRIVWRKEPLKCQVVRQHRTESQDIILRYSCHQCVSFEREGGDQTGLLRKVRQHVDTVHHFKAKKRTPIKRNKTHRGNRFVEVLGENVQRRWACHACPYYYKTKEEWLQHFKQIHVIKQGNPTNSVPEKVLLPNIHLPLRYLST